MLLLLWVLCVRDVVLVSCVAVYVVVVDGCVIVCDVCEVVLLSTLTSLVVIIVDGDVCGVVACVIVMCLCCCWDRGCV